MFSRVNFRKIFLLINQYFQFLYNFEKQICLQAKECLKKLDESNIPQNACILSLVSDVCFWFYLFLMFSCFINNFLIISFRPVAFELFSTNPLDNVIKIHWFLLLQFFLNLLSLQISLFALKNTKMKPLKL